MANAQTDVPTTREEFAARQKNWLRASQKGVLIFFVVFFGWMLGIPLLAERIGFNVQPPLSFWAIGIYLVVGVSMFIAMLRCQSRIAARLGLTCPGCGSPNNSLQRTQAALPPSPLSSEPLDRRGRVGA